MSVKTSRVALLVLSAAILAATVGGAAPPSRHATFTATSSGILFYRGNRLSAPFVIDVTFALTPDTLWLAAYVNHFPLTDTVASVSTIRSTGDASPAGRKSALIERVAKLAPHGRAMGAARVSSASRIQDEARAAPDLVDSIVTRPDGTISFYWRGSARALDLIPPRSSGPRPAPGSDVHAFAMAVARGLEGGSLILVGPNRSLITASRLHTREYLDDIDAIRHGAPWASTHLQNPWITAELISPIDLSSIRRGDY